MADVEKDVVQEFVRLYQRIVSNPLFVTIWDVAAAARQGLEQLRSGNTPFVLPGNAWTGTSGRASSNRYVVGKIFSELREKCECLTFEARFRALNQIRAWLGRRVEALHKNQARRERVHRLTALRYPCSRATGESCRQTIQGREFLGRIEHGMERGGTAWVPVVLLATHDFGRWLNNPERRFTHHQYLDFALGCDALACGPRRTFTRGLGFIRLKLQRFSSAMAMIDADPEGMHLVYRRDI